MILQEGTPGLRRRLSVPDHVLGDNGFGDIDTELQQLAVNPRRTPEGIGLAHAPDQDTNLRVYRRPSSFPALRCPMTTKSFAMPLNHCFRTHDKQDITPSWPNSRDQQPERTVALRKLRASALFL